MKTMQVISTCVLAATLIVLGGLSSVAQEAVTSEAALMHIASSSSPASNFVTGQNFDGIGQNSFGFIDPFIPPDPAGAVGTYQYIEWVNTSLAVFNKGTGEIVDGPIMGNTIWTSMRGPCATYNDGQPVVQFDKLASRWVIGQLVLTGGPPYYFCVAVSTSEDGTPGNYYLYAIQFNDVPDSPRLATWPDAYYVTFNMYNSGGTFLYTNVCALDRSSLLNSQPPRAPLCQQTSMQDSSLMPADLDGTAPPPSGSPNYLLSLGHNALNFWTYYVDFSQGTSQLNGPTAIPVSVFSPACAAINCVDQEGTNQHLTTLSDRVMYRAAYRNFGDHESLTINHTIIFALRYASIRWYELRDLKSNPPSVYQYGTYVPTFIHRWMGNLAMDGMGDMVVAYNFSSKTLHPSLSFADRLVGDPMGQLGGENLLMKGTGSQTSGAAWGNSTSLSVDPVDDCTFWSAGEYQRGDGSPAWNTRISSFSLSSCPSTNPAIQITSAPPFGQDGLLQGTVSNVDPNNYQVNPLLFIPGLGWVSKPYCDPNYVLIHSDGTWSSMVDSGGQGDFTATKYAAYLVKNGFQAACQLGVDGLPYDLESAAAARAYYNRPNPAPTIQFARLNWEIAQNPYKQLLPGSCYYSANNVFLDTSGNLHLKVTDDSGTWYCAQVGTPPQLQQGQQLIQTYGYGTYSFNLASAVDSLQPNIVFGLFTWSDDPAYADNTLPTSPWTNDTNGVGCPGNNICPSHSELDVEFSQYGDGNAQFCVQPYQPNGCFRFTMPSGYNNFTAIINWLPDGISFQLQDPNGNVIEHYDYPGVVPPPGDNGGWAGAVPNAQQVRMNLWTSGTPQNEQEVVISNFTYTPYNQ